MFRTAQVMILPGVASAHYSADNNGAIIQTVAGNLYAFNTHQGANGETCFSKSTDHGLTWSEPVALTATTANSALAVWYDRWSNISAGLIHVAYTTVNGDDTYYRTIDTESADALSTETAVFLGNTTATGGSLSITRAVGGNVYLRTCIDAGAEGGFYRLPNANVPSGAWDAARTINEALATTDQMLLVPDFNSADTQDIYGIFWDASADEISRQNYDDSANTWAETSISTGMVEAFPSATVGYPNFAVAADTANSQTVLLAWTDTDLLNADLKCWTVNSTTITAKTDVVTNSTDDQGLCAIGIDTDTGYWYAFYAGATDGSETFGTDVNVYMKVSTDSGTTWGAETRVTTDNYAQNIQRLFCTPRFTKMWAVTLGMRQSLLTNSHNMYSLSPRTQARAQVLLGV